MSLKISKKAIKEILLSPQVQQLVDSVGEDMAARAGTGYAYRPEDRAQKRSLGVVSPTTYKANRDSIQNMTLVKVLLSHRV